MTIDNVLDLLPFILTVCGSVLVGFQRLASVRSRRFDRVAQLSKAISELGPNDVGIQATFDKERRKIVGLIDSDAYRTREGKWATGLMVVGTLCVLAAAGTSANPELMAASLVLLVVGAIVAVPGVILGFILGTQ